MIAAWLTLAILGAARMSMSEADDILGPLPVREGHFRLESGHHGERWLDLESLGPLCAQGVPLVDVVAGEP